MVQQLEGKEVKRKIWEFIELVGPSLPVHIAKHMNMNTLFVGAFLSEMSSEKTIIISDMKVGGSPLYFTISKKIMLENFTRFLNFREREAQVLLKEKQILQDTEQTPIIRVALRGLKDFAYAFKYQNQIFWRYFTLSEDEAVQRLKAQQPISESSIKNIEYQKENQTKEQVQAQESTKEPLQIQEKTSEQSIQPTSRLVLSSIHTNEIEKMKQQLFDKQTELDKMKEELIEKNKKNEKNPEKILKSFTPKLLKKQKKLNEKEEFLNEIKDYCIKKGVDIKSIELSDKKQIFAIIVWNNKEYLLGAFNKKKTEESDILKTYKKSLIFNIPYLVLSKGEAPKKAKETIDAYKKLASLEKLEQNTLIEE